MKKIISLSLCFVLALMMLVSCSSQKIGDGEKYPESSQIVERLQLNMYIITGDSSSENATNSVATRISGHTKVTYNTELNITYVKESNYESTLLSAIESGQNVPHIVLINSENLFNSLMEKNKLADLSNYYKSRDFGRLNTQIAPALLESSKIDGKLFTVPNNRVIGEYSYLVINKEVAMQTLKYTNAELSSYTSLDDAAELIAEMNSNGYDADRYVKVVNGPYELREELSKENFCNIISVPMITKADAFSSTFAVINSSESKYNDRAMQIIYAINNDSELRNFLQYGVLGANYEVVGGNIVRVKDGENTYDMNLNYTGDVFKADNCEEIGWTDASKGYGKLQNNDSIAG